MANNLHSSFQSNIGKMSRFPLTYGGISHESLLIGEDRIHRHFLMVLRCDDSNCGLESLFNDSRHLFDHRYLIFILVNSTISSNTGIHAYNCKIMAKPFYLLRNHGKRFDWIVVFVMRSSFQRLSRGQIRIWRLWENLLNMTMEIFILFTLQ